MMLLTDRVWVSPGQWGSGAWFGFLLACLGGLVINRAARSDVTYAFLGFYLAILFGRSLWLGEPMSIPWHRLQSGAFLLFAFFMISDPKTTPDTRAGRILFALLVALGAGWVHFVLFRTNGLIWSLALFSLTVPLIDRVLPGKRYEWARLAHMGQQVKDERAERARPRESSAWDCCDGMRCPGMTSKLHPPGINGSREAGSPGNAAVWPARRARAV
jgi:hypothetical protein